MTVEVLSQVGKVTVLAQASAQGTPGTTIQTSVASIALLEAFVDGPLLDGSVAFVQGVGYYSLAKTSTATADGYLVLTTSSGTGRWVLQLPISIANPALLVTDWYWDPANSTGLAADTNSGADSSHPVLTWAGFLAKMGSDTPQLPYGQSLTIHQMSAQPAGQDPVFFKPKLSGGGQFIVDCRSGWVAAGANFSAGTLGGGFGYAGAVPSAGGTQMTMAGVPGYVVGGTMLFNVNRGSYAAVDTTAGSVATLTQPQTSASLTTTTVIPAAVVDNDWQAGDTIQVWTLPLLNAKGIGAEGGDVTAGGQPCAAWIIGAVIADASGIGLSEYAFKCDSANAVLSLCVVSSRLHASGSQGRGVGLYLMGCLVYAATSLYSGAIEVFGGAMYGITTVGGEYIFANNAAVHGAVSIVECRVGIIAGGCFSDGSWTLSQAGVVQVGPGPFWGSYSFNVSVGGLFWNASGGTFTAKALLTNGTLLVAAGPTGLAFAQNGIFYGPFLVTPQNLDTYGGLQQPGVAAFFNGALPQVPVTWSQTTWHVNYSTGTPTGDGLTTGTAVDKASTIRSRWGASRPQLPAITITITCDSGTNGFTDPWSVLLDVDMDPGGSIVMVGAAQAAALSGTIATATGFARTSAGGQIKVTDGSVANFAPYTPAAGTGRGLFHNKITGGIGWLYEPAAGSSATGIVSPNFAPQVAGAISFPTTVLAVAGTNTYEVLPLTSIYMGSGTMLRTAPIGGPSSGAALAFVSRLHLIGHGEEVLDLKTDLLAAIFMQECLIDPALQESGEMFLLNCWQNAGTSWAIMLSLLGANSVWMAGGSYNSVTCLHGLVQIGGDFVFDVAAGDNRAIRTTNGVDATAGGSIELGLVSRWAKAGATDPGIDVAAQTEIRLTPIITDAATVFYGTTQGTDVAHVAAAGLLDWQSSQTATNVFKQDVSTFKIAGSANGWAFNTATGRFAGTADGSNAAITTTTLDAAVNAPGFNGFCQDPASGGRIQKAT